MPALAEVSILAVVPAVPATWVANALAAGATDVDAQAGQPPG